MSAVSVSGECDTRDRVSKNEVWIWPMNSVAEGNEALWWRSTRLKESIISCVDTKLTHRCLPVGLRDRPDCAVCVSHFQTDYQSKSQNTYIYNECQGIKKCVQIQCIHLTLNRMKALLLSSASSRLQAFCLSHQQVWLSCWSCETELMKRSVFLYPRSKRDSISLLFRFLLSFQPCRSQI